jgi:hypothetical protein
MYKKILHLTMALHGSPRNRVCCDAVCGIEILGGSGIPYSTAWPKPNKRFSRDWRTSICEKTWLAVSTVLAGLISALRATSQRRARHAISAQQAYERRVAWRGQDSVSCHRSALSAQGVVCCLLRDVISGVYVQEAGEEGNDDPGMGSLDRRRDAQQHGGVRAWRGLAPCLLATPAVVWPISVTAVVKVGPRLH